MTPERLMDIKIYQAQSAVYAARAREYLFSLIQHNAEYPINNVGAYAGDLRREAISNQRQSRQDFEASCELRGIEI